MSAPPAAPAPPRLLLLVPYRDREAQRAWLSAHLRDTLLAGLRRDEWELWFLHQADARPFNRGAMKNLGFLFARARYPEAYGAMTLVFHDVDTAPVAAGIFDYATEPGTVKHFYGLPTVLGGIVSICGADFERCGGFPNFWSWGYEDNLLQRRVLAAGLHIDRASFRPFRHPDVCQWQDEGPLRAVAPADVDRFLFDHAAEADGWRDLRAVRWCANAEAGLVHVFAFEARHPAPAPDELVLADVTRHATLIPFSQRKRPFQFAFRAETGPAR